MAREGYKAEVTNSSKELTAKQKISYKTFADCESVDAVVTGDIALTIDKVEGWAIVDVHNEKAENKEYDVIIIEGDGRRYKSGSSSLIDSFLDIWYEMDAEEEDFGITIKKIESNNYKGKYFLKAEII